MAKYLYPEDQKQPNRKYKEDGVSVDKTPRTKLSEISFPTSEGDLGILGIKSKDIPKQTRAPSLTGDGLSHAMKNVMKKAGIFG